MHLCNFDCQDLFFYKTCMLQVCIIIGDEIGYIAHAWMDSRVNTKHATRVL